MKISPMQNKFCQIYILNGYNGYKAYQEAGYSCVKESTAMSAVSRLLSNVKIKLHISKLERLQRESFKIEKEDILHELAKMAFGNIGDIVDIEHGSFKLKDDVDPVKKRNFLAGVSGISSSSTFGKDGQSKSFSIASKDKIKALELIAKMTGVLDAANDNGDEKPSISRVLDAIRSIKK